MTGRPDNPEDRPARQESTPGGSPSEQGQDGPVRSRFAVPQWARTGSGEAPPGERRSSGLSMPRWARPAVGSQRPSGWRGWLGLLRRRLIWPVAVVLVLFAVWSNYPFIPNPWVYLFGQPGGDASAESSPARWAMQGADPQGTSHLPGAAAPRGVPAFTVEVAGEVRSAPAVGDGALYIGGQSRIAAYDTSTGQLLWEHAVDGPAHGTPTLAGGLVYLGLLGKRVVALHPESGDVSWEFRGDDPFPGAVTVLDGIVYAPSRGGEVQALDALTGEQLWKVDAGAPVVAPVAVAEGRMFAASTAGLLFIRNSRTGDKRTRIRTSGALVFPPVVDGEQVYLLSEGDLMAFDTSVREMPGRYPAELIWAQLWLWRFPLPPPPEHSGLLWRITPGEGRGSFAHPPALTPEALYAVTDMGEVMALSRDDGSVLWRLQAGEPVAASPVVAGDLLLLAHADGSIRAIDRHSRREVWALSLGSPAVAPLSLADGTVYVHTRDGRLHAIR